MNQARKVSPDMNLPVRVKIELTDDNWRLVLHHHQEEVKFILEDGEHFIVEYPTRTIYEKQLERMCGMVKFKEVNQENVEL